MSVSVGNSWLCWVSRHTGSRHASRSCCSYTFVHTGDVMTHIHPGHVTLGHVTPHSHAGDVMMHVHAGDVTMHVHARHFTLQVAAHRDAHGASRRTARPRRHVHVPRRRPAPRRRRYRCPGPRLPALHGRQELSRRESFSQHVWTVTAGEHSLQRSSFSHGCAHVCLGPT